VVSNRLEFDFSGKTVIVAGGPSGLNLGVAHNFADAGANLGVISRSSDKVDAAVALLTQSGSRACGFSADVRNSSAIEDAFQYFNDEYGELDVVISGAAGNFPAYATDMTPNGFAAVVNIDLLGTYHVLRAAYPHLKKPGSTVINISAPQAFVPMILQSHVCAAKAGVDMLTRTFALEWGCKGIRVNSIVPGPIQNTEGMQRLAPTQTLLDKVMKSVPLKRLGQATDIGNAAIFLASPLADYISGAILPVDGGWSLSGVSGLMNELASEAEAH